MTVVEFGLTCITPEKDTYLIQKIKKFTEIKLIHWNTFTTRKCNTLITPVVKTSSPRCFNFNLMRMKSSFCWTSRFFCNHHLRKCFSAIKRVLYFFCRFWMVLLCDIFCYFIHIIAHPLSIGIFIFLQESIVNKRLYLICGRIYVDQYVVFNTTYRQHCQVDIMPIIKTVLCDTMSRYSSY